jgi:hypothetical protein
LRNEIDVANLLGIQVEDEDDRYDLGYEFASWLVQRDGSYTYSIKRLGIDLKQYNDRFVQIAEYRDAGDYAYSGTVHWVFVDKETQINYMVTASADSWDDDGAMGEDYSFDIVYPKEVTKTIYVTEDKL